MTSPVTYAEKRTALEILTAKAFSVVPWSSHQMNEEQRQAVILAALDGHESALVKSLTKDCLATGASLVRMHAALEDALGRLRRSLELDDNADWAIDACINSIREKAGLGPISLSPESNEAA